MYAHIITEVLSTPWAILPEKLAAIRELLALRASGQRFTAEEIRARVGDPAKPRPRRGGGVAVIPVYGTLNQRMNLMSEMSGGTSTERLTQDINEAVRDDAIANIVLDIDSPGGSVFGIEALGDTIYRARSEKPIIAQVNSLAASAAYWLAASATEIVAAPGSYVGSIGVYALHLDQSEHMANEGVRATYVSAGRYKVEGNPFEPLSDEARAAVQRRVDLAYDAFVSAVARGRGVKANEVRNGFGEGRVLHAKDGMAEGMVDRIATLSQTFERLGVGGRGGTGVSADMEVPEVEAVADGAEGLQNGSPAHTIALKRRRARL
jgi:signal peptide peptidase SppA